ncbi:hypothetical protein GCM10023306_07780 [Novosphingobium ginsenosidimutans]
MLPGLRDRQHLALVAAQLPATRGEPAGEFRGEVGGLVRHGGLVDERHPQERGMNLAPGKARKKAGRT